MHAHTRLTESWILDEFNKSTSSFPELNPNQPQKMIIGKESANHNIMTPKRILGIFWLLWLLDPEKFILSFTLGQSLTDQG